MANDEYTNLPNSQNEPDSLIVTALIHALSMACQGIIDVKIPTGKVRRASLNMMTVAEPGQSKTSVYSVERNAMAKEDV